MHKSLILVPILLAVFFFVYSLDKKDSADTENMTVETREVSEFNKINFIGSGNLFINQGDHEALKIEAPQDLAALITAEVTNGTLNIIVKDNPARRSNANEPTNVYATVKTLKEIHLTGSAMISSRHLFVEDLSIILKGSGHCTLNVIGKKLTSLISGSGKFSLTGHVESQEIRINGSGNYEAKDLASNIATVTLNGAGLVVLNVNEKLNVSIAGAGKVSYKGSPQVIETISGAGLIEKLESSGS